MYQKISFSGVSEVGGYRLLIPLIRESVFHLSFSLLTQLLGLETAFLNDNWLCVTMTKEIVQELDYDGSIQDDLLFVRYVYSVLNLGSKDVSIDIFIH